MIHFTQDKVREVILMNTSGIVDKDTIGIKLNTNEENIYNELEPTNASFDDAYEWDTETGQYVKRTESDETTDEVKIQKISEFKIEENNEVTSITTIRERRISTAQNMFKKSIRVSLKSFLIAISLSFLNLFI